MGFLNKKITQIIDKKDITLAKNKLINTSWLKMNTGYSKITYSFQNNKELIISIDGDGVRAKWEFMIDNDSLIIEKENIEVFNCQIIHDEFLVLNKDNTTLLEIYGNLSKFKSNQEKEVQSKFNSLFEKLSITDSIDPSEKLFILKVYEILTLIDSGTGKHRLKKLFNNVVYDEKSGEHFELAFKKLANRTIVQSLNRSKFDKKELIDIAESLILHHVVQP
jgi:hypothetical protein